MTVLVVTTILIGILLISMNYFNDKMLGTYFLIGGVVALIGTGLTVSAVLYCARRHNSAKKDGFGILPPMETNPTSLASTATTTSENTYVRNEKRMNTSVSPDAERPHTSGLRNDSIASDYTESHYYTEIDEYYINKRIAKQQQKVLKRQESPGSQVPPATMAPHVDSSNNIYDYAYGINPHLVASKQKNTKTGR